MNTTLLKWASRGRPKLVAERLPAWDVPGVRFLFSLDRDDSSLPAYRDVLYGRPNVTVIEGDSSGKVHAINRDIDAHGGEWDMILAVSDDFVVQRPDYAELLRAALFTAFPDGDGMVQFPDGRRNDNLNTCPVMGRAFYSRFGYVYRGLPTITDRSDGYTSTHCDDEQTAVSHALGRVVHLSECIARHDWIGDTDPHDPVHRRNESHFMRDAKTYERRKAAGFPA